MLLVDTVLLSTEAALDKCKIEVQNTNLCILNHSHNLPNLINVHVSNPRKKSIDQIQQHYHKFIVLGLETKYITQAFSFENTRPCRIK